MKIKAFQKIFFFKTPKIKLTCCRFARSEAHCLRGCRCSHTWFFDLIRETNLNQTVFKFNEQGFVEVSIRENSQHLMDDPNENAR